MKKKHLLVLSGGAAKGAYQAGAIKYLLGEQQICYDGFVGTSVGGLNSGLLSMFKSGEEVSASKYVQDVWASIRGSKDIYKGYCLGKLHFFMPRWTRLNKPSLYNNAPLRGLVCKHLDQDKVIKSGKSLCLVAVSLDTGDIRYFHEDFRDLHAALMATSSFPGAFPPERIDNEWFTDGGVKEITAISAAIDMGATHIDAVITSPDPYPYKPLNSDPEGIEIAERVIDLMSDEISHNDVPSVQRVNKRVLDGDNADNKRFIELRVMRPDSILTDDSLNFDPTLISDMIQRGYADAQHVFA